MLRPSAGGAGVLCPFRRPWLDPRDNKWYALLSFDGCNETTAEAGLCPKGGEAKMWSSPALFGTSLSGSISTIWTVLSWMCVGIRSYRVLPSHVCA